MSSRFGNLSPTSRGATVIGCDEFEAFVDTAISGAIEQRALGGLLLLRLSEESGNPVVGEALTQGAYVFGQLARQGDAVAVLEDGLLGFVFRVLDRRSDAHVLMDRFESFAAAAAVPYCFSLGMSIFPLSGRGAMQVMDAARRDLLGAMSSDTYEHQIPRDTLLTRSVG